MTPNGNAHQQTQPHEALKELQDTTSQGFLVLEQSLGQDSGIDSAFSAKARWQPKASNFVHHLPLLPP